MDEVKAATLLGRGGAGFPAGTKWGFCPPGVWPRYIVVNGDESEPGTYKDRILMERDPHQLIEGCLIAAYAIGAAQVFLYVRGEMAHAQERIAAALNEAYDANLIGKNILGTDFSVDIVLHWGAGAYIVGEETALIESLEGNRGMPRLKPPFFPAAKGLYMKPTIVNNVETLANLPWLMCNGVDAYKAFGSEASPGTRLVAVSGHVKRPGVYEIPQGTTTYRELFYDERYGGGIRDDNELKYVHPRWRVAPWFFPEQVDLPLEGRVVGAAGSMLGSGAIVVMDETTDAVRACLRVVRFFARESCGQVHAVSRGHVVGGEDPAADPRRSGSPVRHRRAARRGRQHLPGALPGRGRPRRRPRGRAVPATPDHDLPAGPVVGGADHLGAPPLPSRVRGEDHQARPHRRHRRTGRHERSPGGWSLMAERPRKIEITDPVTITVDGTDVEVQKGELLIDACERNGTYIPRFCYHPRMEPVGMCRMCLVEVDTGRGPALQPSCMIEATPEMKVDTESDKVKKAQDGVLEFLLINHPLDCPVCDKGGECPLQDQTIAYGPGESRFTEEKRHYPKPIPISETRVPRSRALHPLRSLHAVREGRRRRPADPLHRPWRPTRRSTRSPVSRSRRTSPATPSRSARWAR